MGKVLIAIGTVLACDGVSPQRSGNNTVWSNMNGFDPFECDAWRTGTQLTRANAHNLTTLFKCKLKKCQRLNTSHA